MKNEEGKANGFRSPKASAEFEYFILRFWPQLVTFHSPFFILTSSFRPLRPFCLGLLLLMTAGSARAHLPLIASATAMIETNGDYSVNLTFDLPPFVLQVSPQNANDPAMNAWLDGPTNVIAASLAAAEARFRKGFAALADDKPAAIEQLIFPTAVDVVRYRESAPSVRLPAMLMLSLNGRLPTGTRSVSFQFPAEMGAVALSVMRPDAEPAVLVANPGAASVPLPLTSPGSTAFQSNSVPVPEPSHWLVVRQYILLGFEHILPEGTDHILFVLGLFLLSCRIKPLLWQVTAFTVAHSITLGLAMYGVIRLPSTVVEPMIAASIAFVAVENICTPELKPWRPVVVFCFGLIHGLGFSSVLLSLGLPRKDFVTALVSFNGGVELGQLTVIAGAFLMVGWWRNRPWYRKSIVIPASVLIAATGVFWTIQRIALAMN
jgi:hypothetical protein